jgi:hypothetical protein
MQLTTEFDLFTKNNYNYVQFKLMHRICKYARDASNSDGERTNLRRTKKALISARDTLSTTIVVPSPHFSVVIVVAALAPLFLSFPWSFSPHVQQRKKSTTQFQRSMWPLEE